MGKLKISSSELSSKANGPLLAMLGLTREKISGKTTSADVHAGALAYARDALTKSGISFTEGGAESTDSDDSPVASAAPAERVTKKRKKKKRTRD
jgi:hypothetical protein